MTQTNGVAIIIEVVDWIRATVPDDAHLIVPISGGSDSALCFYLCNQALPEQVTGVYFGHELRCKAWFDAVGPVRIVPYETDFLDQEAYRWAWLVGTAVHEDRILVGTRNKTEYTLGAYSTASKVAALLPLIGFWKADIMSLCEQIGVPPDILTSSKQADADCGRPAELAALSFESVDDFLKQKLGEIPSNTELQMGTPEIEYLEQLYARNSYKKLLPYNGPSVSLKK